MEQDELLSQFKQELTKIISEACFGYVDITPNGILLMFKGGIEAPENYMISLLGLWQITESGQPVCAYSGMNNHDGRLFSHLGRLQSQHVTDVRLRERDMNLYVLFESGLKLSLFPDTNSARNYLYFYRRVKYLSEYGRPPAFIDGGIFDVGINLKIGITWMQSGSE